MPRYRGGGDPIAQVVFVERLLNADGNRFQIASGQAAVGWIAFGQDQQVLFLLGQRSSFVQRKPPILAMPSFLADMVQPSPSRNISWAICLGVAICEAGLAQLDEIGIFGEAAGVEIKRDLVLPADRADGARVLHRNRLAAAGVIRDCQHHQWNALAAYPRDQFFERG